MRLSSVVVLLAAVCVQISIAAPLIKPRQSDVSCEEADDNGSPLTNERAAQQDDDNSGGTVCVYEDAGTCRYFFDGTFSSGASTCPNAMKQGGGTQFTTSMTLVIVPPEPSTSTTMVFVTPTTTPSPTTTPPVVTQPSTTSTVPVSESVSPSPTTEADDAADDDGVSQNAGEGGENGALPRGGQAPFMMLATVAGVIAGGLALF